MSAMTARLLAEYEGLPIDEKQVFIREVFSRLPPLDSGPLDDSVLTDAADQLAGIIEEEERDSQTR